MVRINTTALRAFLLWGYRHSPSYFTAEQVEYLSPGVVMPRPALIGTPAPRRRTTTRRVGQSGDYIEDEDAPSPRWLRSERHSSPVSVPGPGSRPSSPPAAVQGGASRATPVARPRVGTHG
jgi:hypothetical protein